jgi:hypothetical protein
LEALWTFGDFEFNRLAVVQRLVAIRHDCGEMDENVLTAHALDESKAFAGVKPLHCSLFHFVTCSCFEFLLRRIVATEEGITLLRNLLFKCA